VLYVGLIDTGAAHSVSNNTQRVGDNILNLDTIGTADSDQVHDAALHRPKL
jgi:hypothetical protein